MDELQCVLALKLTGLQMMRTKPQGTLTLRLLDKQNPRVVYAVDGSREPPMKNSAGPLR